LRPRGLNVGLEARRRAKPLHADRTLIHALCPSPSARAQGRCLSAPDAHILPRLITRRVRQWSLVIKHGAQFAHVDPTATRFASEEMLGLVDRLHADALADDGRNRRCHARNLGSARISDVGTALLRLVCTENLSSGVVVVKSAKDGV
jgi:hypothetical protein